MIKHENNMLFILLEHLLPARCKKKKHVQKTGPMFTG